MFRSLKKIKKNGGMTYVELIVVLSIFATMSSIVVFNYGDFQARVDIKNLANDIALKVVEAQKSAVFGIIPPVAQQALITSVETWKPAYGMYFNLTSDRQSFIYFTDADSNNLYQDSNCTGECIEKISINKGNSISALDIFYEGDTNPHSFNDISVTFTRPNLGAEIRSTAVFSGTVSYVQATILSPKGNTAAVKIYASGRVQIN